MAAQPEKISFRERLKQIRLAFSYTAKRDRLFVPLVILAAGLPLAATVAWIAVGGDWLWAPVGVLLALLGVMVVLNLRANRAMLAEAEGQPGAAAAILQTMRGDWRITPAAQATTQGDFVHRVIGKPGVVLVAEGSPGRIRGLLSQERKRLARVVGDTPIYDFVVGPADGQVPIRRLRTTLMKLPRNITGKQVNALDTRLRALSTRPQMPKGPIPKNLRPKGLNRMLRGR